MFQGPLGRMARWGTGITLAGFLTGGGFAIAAAAGSSAPTASQGTSQDVSALLAASGTAASSTAAAGTVKHRRQPIPRLRTLGGMYGSFTFRTKAGADRTLAFERGTIESMTSSDIVVRAPDGTTITWLLASGTVVRDLGKFGKFGKSSTSALADGQRVFVGGPVVSGARNAQLIAIRTGGSAKTSSTSVN
jgi:hypothetical protein